MTDEEIRELRACALALALGVGDRLDWVQLDMLAGEVQEALKAEMGRCPGAAGRSAPGLVHDDGDR